MTCLWGIGPGSVKGAMLYLEDFNDGSNGWAGRDAAFSEYGCGGPRFGLEDLRRFEKPYGRKALSGSLNWREAEGRPKMVRTIQWKYVHDPMDGKDELYDLDQDPGELYNVAAEPRNRDVLTEMKTRLMDWSIHTEDAVPVPLP